MQTSNTPNHQKSTVSSSAKAVNATEAPKVEVAASTPYYSAIAASTLSGDHDDDYDKSLSEGSNPINKDDTSNIWNKNSNSFVPQGASDVGKGNSEDDKAKKRLDKLLHDLKNKDHTLDLLLEDFKIQKSQPLQSKVREDEIERSIDKRVKQLSSLEIVANINKKIFTVTYEGNFNAKLRKDLRKFFTVENADHWEVLSKHINEIRNIIDGNTAAQRNVQAFLDTVTEKIKQIPKAKYSEMQEDILTIFKAFIAPLKNAEFCRIELLRAAHDMVKDSPSFNAECKKEIQAILQHDLQQQLQQQQLSAHKDATNNNMQAMLRDANKERDTTRVHNAQKLADTHKSSRNKHLLNAGISGVALIPIIAGVATLLKDFLEKNPQILEENKWILPTAIIGITLVAVALLIPSIVNAFKEHKCMKECEAKCCTLLKNSTVEQQSQNQQQAA